MQQHLIHFCSSWHCSHYYLYSIYATRMAKFIKESSKVLENNYLKPIKRVIKVKDMLKALSPGRFSSIFVAFDLFAMLNECRNFQLLCCSSHCSSALIILFPQVKHCETVYLLWVETLPFKLLLGLELKIVMKVSGFEQIPAADDTWYSNLSCVSHLFTVLPCKTVHLMLLCNKTFSVPLYLFEE